MPSQWPVPVMIGVTLVPISISGWGLQRTAVISLLGHYGFVKKISLALTTPYSQVRHGIGDDATGAGTADQGRAADLCDGLRDHIAHPECQSRAFDRVALAQSMETFVCRATRSSGLPRNSRATIAILRQSRKGLVPFPSTPEGAPTPALGPLRGPFGLALFSTRHVKYSG